MGGKEEGGKKERRKERKVGKRGRQRKRSFPCVVTVDKNLVSCLARLRCFPKWLLLDLYMPTQQLLLCGGNTPVYKVNVSRVLSA